MERDGSPVASAYWDFSLKIYKSKKQFNLFKKAC